MAINKNHEFEELGGVKCAIVEKNASKERVAFLKELLEYNGFEVVVVPSPPPKAAPAPKPAATTESPAPPQTPNIELQPSNAEPKPVVPETFTVGVTNLAFNPTNAIFGRLLKTKEGHVVTQTYWYQKDAISRDDIPYYEQKM
jgi:hypothetical protein